MLKQCHVIGQRKLVLQKSLGGSLTENRIFTPSSESGSYASRVSNFPRHVFDTRRRKPWRTGNNGSFQRGSDGLPPEVISVFTSFESRFISSPFVPVADSRHLSCAQIGNDTRSKKVKTSTKMFSAAVTPRSLTTRLSLEYEHFCREQIEAECRYGLFSLVHSWDMSEQIHAKRNGSFGTFSKLSFQSNNVPLRNAV